MSGRTFIRFLNSFLHTGTPGSSTFLRGDGAWKTVTETVTISIPLVSYDAQPARASESNVHGGILSLDTASPLDPTPTNIVVSQGSGKLFIVVNAGSDLVGSVTFTGTTIDRDTGVTTPSDTDVVTINGLTTDTSTTDTNGNVVHGFSNAYMTSKWFTGSVTLSTSDVTLTDVDTYHCSFEQFNDTHNIELDTFDINVLATHVNAELDAYLYSVVNNSGILAITNEAELHLGSGGITAVANKYYRLRRSNIAKDLDCSSDGIFVDANYSNSPAYIEDITMKVWGILRE